MPDEKDKPMKGEDWKVEFDPEIVEQMKNDPEVAELIKITIARMRQALDGVSQTDDELLDERLTGMGFKKIILDENGDPIE